MKVKTLYGTAYCLGIVGYASLAGATELGGGWTSYLVPTVMVLIAAVCGWLGRRLEIEQKRRARNRKKRSILLQR